jgi:hypothetical protein
MSDAVVIQEMGRLTDLEACDCKIVFGPQHVQVFTHPAHIGVAEVSLVEPFCEVCQTAVCEDEEVDFVEESDQLDAGFLLHGKYFYVLLFARRGAFWVPYEERWTVLAVGRREEVPDIVRYWKPHLDSIWSSRGTSSGRLQENGIWTLFCRLHMLPLVIFALSRGSIL